jgi:hypothetical protein
MTVTNVPDNNPFVNQHQHQVKLDDLTFDDVYRILRRLMLWAGLLGEEARGAASARDYTSLEDLTEGLEESHLYRIDDDFLPSIEKLLLRHDAVLLWRAAKAMDNHKEQLLKHFESRWTPEQKEKTKWFWIRAV